MPDCDCTGRRVRAAILAVAAMASFLTYDSRRGSSVERVRRVCAQVAVALLIASLVSDNLAIWILAGVVLTLVLEDGHSYWSTAGAA